MAAASIYVDASTQAEIDLLSGIIYVGVVSLLDFRAINVISRLHSRSSMKPLIR